MGRVSSPVISLPAALMAGGVTRLHLPDLAALVASPDAVPWFPFRPGVEIHRLYGDGETGPSAALLKFEPGGVVPMHLHLGYEHIFVLSGSQQDSGGLAEAGSLLIHAPGSKHRVWSDAGCVVLAVYEQPVEFLE